MSVVCGIDPGNNGALAFLDYRKALIHVIDMPTFEFTTTKNRTEIDPHGIVRALSEYKIEHVYLEEVFSSPQMGVTSAFNFGQGKGMIRGVVAALKIPLTQIKPAKWKKDMHVPADKKAAVARASQLIPGAASCFRGPRGAALDGRAEAALLALYGALELGCNPTRPLTMVNGE